MHQKMFVPVLLFLASISGCQKRDDSTPPVSGISSGSFAGYLSQQELPDYLSLLPIPPQAGSARQTLDENISAQTLQLQGTPRWNLSIKDAAIPQSADAFSCELNIPISKQITPHLHTLMQRIYTDMRNASSSVKNIYQRTRPFVWNKHPLCIPGQAALLAQHGSYPSLHSALGWAWALVLSEIDPSRASAILARGHTYGDGRIVCNAHWYSDVVEGRILGAATVSRLHANSSFLADVIAARNEIESVRAKNIALTHNCETETAASKSPPPY